MEKIIDYPIIKNVATNGGIYYTVIVYSGNKPLTMLIDTGAYRGVIRGIILKDCLFDTTDINSNVYGAISHIDNASKIILKIGFKESDNCIYYWYNMETSVFPEAHKTLFEAQKIDGIIGACFLQKCILNLPKCILSIYK